jgi:hypothetical protein
MTVQEVYRRAKQLTPEEKKELVELLTEGEKPEETDASPRPSLMDLQGLVPYPFFGEEAQDYITRTRAEWAEREKAWRDPSH